MLLRTLLTISLLWLTLAGLHAQAAEDFNYPAGTELAGADAGAGFTGPWSLVGGATPTIEAGGITSGGIERQSSGNRAVAAANTRIVRSLPDGVGDNGNTYWISYFFQTENPGPNVSHFVLADAAALMATGPDGRLAQIGSGFNNPNIALVGGGGTGISSAEGRFVVLEVVTNGTAEPDSIFIYIDPDPDDDISRDDVNAMGTRDLSAWNAIALLQDGNAGVTANWDAITVADSYAAAVPGDLIDTGTDRSAIAFDKFSYPAGSSILGLGDAEDGWAGPWDTIASDTIVTTIVNGGVVNNNLLARTSTNSLRGTSVGQNNRAIRYLDEPLTPADNDTIWFSTHASVSGNVGGNVGTIVFSDTTQDNYERIIIGKRFGNRNLFATGAGAGPTNSGQFFTGSSARYIVGRLVASDTSENWILHLWVDPQPDLEPATDTADIADKLFPTANFNAVSIKTEGAPGLNFNVDDLFLGSTYAEVVPDDLTPVGPVPAPAMEPFDYAVGDSLDGQNGGSGWDGPWMQVSDGNAAITEGGITSLPLLKQTSGNKVSFTANGRHMRKLAGDYGDTGRSHWVGWFFDTDNGGPNVTNLVLANSETFPDGGAGELLQVGKAFNQGAIRIIGGGSTNISADEGHFVVVEVVTNGTAANDEIYVWIDPDLSRTPSRDTADATGARNLTGWDAIGLKVAGDPGVTAMWDDIYVGNAYGDIVPSDLLDVQNPDEAVTAYEPFDYQDGADLDGLDGGEGWGGPWVAEQGDINIVAGSIMSDRVEGRGNRAEVTQGGSSGDIRYSRPYFTRFAEDSPEKQTVWFSYLLDVTNNGIGNSGGVALLDGNNTLIEVGAVAGLNNIGVSYSGGAPRTSTDVTANTQNWVVIRLDLYGSGVVDTGFVWINPTADVLPDTANAEFKLYDLVADNGFDRVGIQASGALNLDFETDELYTGFSYRDVSPGFGSDDPDLLAYEPFNYDAGQSLFGLGGVNAFWDGVWTDAGAFGDVNELTITEGSVGMDDFATVGNKVEFAYLEPSTTMRADRDLAFPLTSDGREYWITFLMNTTEAAATDNVANVTLRSSGIANRDGQRMSIGRQFGQDGANKLGFVTPPSGNARRSEIDDEGLHWLVVRIGTNADVNVPDTVEMWIDPSVDERPDTSTAAIISTIGVLKDAPIDVIRIRVEGSGANQTPYITNFDELRIATDWPSATLVSNAIAPEEDDVFELSAFPNPFGDELNVRFNAARAGRYELQLFDISGRQVANLLSADLPAGEQQLRWNNADLANGFYFLRVVHGNQRTVRKLLLYR